MAAGANLNAKLVLTLTDRATRGLMELQRRIQGLAALGRRIGAIGALGGALSFAAIIPQAAAFEGQLRNIAITAGNVGREVERAIGKTGRLVQDTALRVRESSDEMLTGYGALSNRGLDPGLVEGLIDPLARLKSASAAAAQDLGQMYVAFERLAGLKTVAEIEQAGAVAFRGGQIGGFELKDSARFLPGQLAQMQSLNLRGMEAVRTATALSQTIRDGMGNTEEAGGAIQQMLGQLFSDQTKRAMKELGVDLNGVMRNAVRAGVNPIEALMFKISQVVGDDQTLLNQILPDQNARLAFSAWLAQVDRYKAMKKQLEAAGPADVNQAADDRQRGLSSEWRRFQEVLKQISVQLGSGANSALAELNTLLERLLTGLRDLDGRFPGMIENFTKWGVVLAGLVGAAGALTLLLALLNPVSVGLTAIAAAALLVVTNWEEVEAYLARSWRSLRDGFVGVWDAAQKRFDEFVSWIKQQLEPIERLLASMARIMGAAQQGREFRRQSEEQGAPTGEQRLNRYRDRGRLGGFYGDDPAIEPQSAPGGGAESRWTGRIEIALADGLVLRRREADTAAVTFAAPDRGLMLKGV